MITHTQVLAAAAATGDMELADWVETDEDYAVGAASFPGLAQHGVFLLHPNHVSHPMSVYIAKPSGEGEAYFVSGRLEGFARLVRKEPALLEGEGAAARAAELLCALSDSCRLVEDDEGLEGISAEAALQIMPARIDSGPQGWALELFVVDDIQRLQRWSIGVPADGAPTFERATLAEKVGGAP